MNQVSSKKTDKSVNVYVSGPMTGLTKAEYRANFISASVKAVSYVLHREYPNQPNVVIVDPSAKIGVVDGLSYSDCLYIDCAFIQRCQYLYLMRGWEKSKGARFERHYAEIMGITILYEDPQIEIKCPKCGSVDLYDMNQPISPRIECSNSCGQIIDTERYLR